MADEKWLEWAVQLQSLAQCGLAYTDNIFDIERYKSIRKISSEMVSTATGLPLEKVTDLFCNEEGYQTPKLDTRAAIFKGKTVLLVKEQDGLWSLPGGWCDVDQSVKENVVKEVQEEAGLRVKADKIVAVLDKAKNNPSRSVHRVCKVFVLCSSLGGEFVPNAETQASAYFSLDALPPLSLGKNTAEQIELCYEAYLAEHWDARFD